MSGPFDPATELKPSSSRRREPRDWEREFDSSINVGKEGRKNARARLEKKAQEQEANNDPDDWFGNPRNARNRGMDTSSHRGGTKGPPPGVKKLSFVVKDASRQFQPPSSAPPTGPRHRRPSDSLLDRLGGVEDRGDPRRRHRDRPSHSGENYGSSKRRSGVNGRAEGRERGPRYKGGYAR